MTRRAVLLFFFITWFGGCRQPAPVRVAVAANAQYVAQVLKQEFEKETGIALELVVNSSGKITAQVAQGAPYDVFLSADTKYPQALYTKGLTSVPPRIYAYGKLIVWTRNKTIDLNRPLAELLQATAGKIAIANPESAPYGLAALQALRYAGLEETVAPRLVLGESVAQVNQYLLTGAADLGFTSLSVVAEPAMKGKGQWREVPADAYSPIAQSAVLLRIADSGKAEQAARFYQFLFGLKAQSIFRRHGYVTGASKI